MERLKQLRNSRSLTQQDIARLLGVERSTYVKYERGQSDPPTATLVRLADYFGVSVDYIIGRDFESAGSIPVVPSIPEADKKLLAMFHALDDMAQARILNALDFEYQAIPQENAKSSNFTA